MTSQGRRPMHEAGFALILAILALMLLTFLGLTLATTTSTELQISNNYRWGQQALYNAEAGLEAARALLGRIGDGQLVLPPARAIAWDPDSPAVKNRPQDGTPPPLYPATRNFEGAFCDAWGYGAGYGQVLVDPNDPGNPYQNLHTVFGQSVSGAFTVWVRRDIVFNPPVGGGAGTLSDNPAGENIVVTAEGSAPFGVDSAFARTNRSIRRLESKIVVREGCRSQFNSDSQTGMRDCEDL